MEFAAGAGNENSEEQPGAAFRDLHQQPAGAAELLVERQGEAGGRTRQHPVPGRGLQEEVSLELMLYSPGQVQHPLNILKATGGSRRVWDPGILGNDIFSKRNFLSNGATDSNMPTFGE